MYTIKEANLVLHLLIWTTLDTSYPQIYVLIMWRMTHTVAGLVHDLHFPAAIHTSMLGTPKTHYLATSSTTCKGLIPKAYH